MNKYFYCYNARMSKFIIDKGVQYVTQAYHKETWNMFTLFERSDQLEQAIQEYRRLHSK